MREPARAGRAAALDRLPGLAVVRPQIVETAGGVVALAPDRRATEEQHALVLAVVGHRGRAPRGRALNAALRPVAAVELPGLGLRRTVGPAPEHDNLLAPGV